MGFIKGRAYPIILAMAKDGNKEAQELLDNVASMAQDEVDNRLGKIFGNSSGSSAKPAEEKSSKPFVYTSMGRKKAKVDDGQPFTDERKAQLSKDLGPGIEVYDSVTEETFLTKADEQKPQSFSEVENEPEDIEINQGYAFTEAQKDEFDKKYSQGTVIREQFSNDVYFAGGMSKGAEDFIAKAYSDKGGRLSKKDIEGIKQETGVSDRGINKFLDKIERGKSNKRARKEIASLLKADIERDELTDQTLKQLANEFAFDIEEIKQIKNEMIESKKAIPSLTKPSQSSLDESRLENITIKNTANQNFAQRKNEPELEDFPGVDAILFKEENQYTGPTKGHFYTRPPQETVQNGGVTVQLGNVITPEEGYQVAYDKESEKIFNANEMQRAYNWIKSNGLQNFGIWINKDKKNEIVIDTTSSYVKNEKEALQMAELANQDSILDWAASKAAGELVFIDKKEYMQRLKKLKGV
jgi:hypothetical protein